MLGDFEAKGEVEPAVQAHGATQINRTELFPINKQPVPIDIVPVETEDGLDSAFEARFEPRTLPAPKIDGAPCWQQIEYHWHDGLCRDMGSMDKAVEKCLVVRSARWSFHFGLFSTEGFCQLDSALRTLLLIRACL